MRKTSAPFLLLLAQALQACFTLGPSPDSLLPSTESPLHFDGLVLAPNE